MIINVKPPTSYLPTFVVEARPNGAIDTSTDETLLTDLLFEKRIFESGYIDFKIEVATVQIGDTWTLVNNTPEICDLDEDGLVTRITSGYGEISLLGEGNKQSIPLSFTSGEYTSYVWKGFTGTSVSSTLSNTIRNMIDAGGDLCYFDNYAQGQTTATVNPDRWFTPDISASALVTEVFGTWTTANSGCLISPRVFIGVAHWDANTATNLTAGRKLRFVSAAGNINERTILSRYKPANYDLYVCILSDNHDEDILPMKIAGDWFVEAIDGSSSRCLGMGFQIHQDKRITGCVFDAVLNGGTFPSVYHATSDITFIHWINLAEYFSDSDSWLYGRDEFFTAGITGDSGGIIGTVVDGEAVLVSLFTGGNAGYIYYGGIEADLNAWIQSAAAIAGVTITDTVTVAADPTL